MRAIVAYAAVGYWVKTHRPLRAAWRTGSLAFSNRDCRRGSTRLIARVSVSAAIRIRALLDMASTRALGATNVNCSSVAVSSKNS